MARVCPVTSGALYALFQNPRNLLPDHCEDQAAFRRNLIVDAKVKKMAAAVCQKVAKSYPCGIRKQRLQDKFDRLYKIKPDKLSRYLDMLEKGVL